MCYNLQPIMSQALAQPSCWPFQCQSVGSHKHAIVHDRLHPMFAPACSAYQCLPCTNVICQNKQHRVSDIRPYPTGTSSPNVCLCRGAGKNKSSDAR